ncbi:MAG: hypothetical protein ACREQN_16560 [Candidatus Binataceae bacterium]
MESGQRGVASTPLGCEHSVAMQISFVSANQGWLFTDYGRLLSTDDGGATWSDITPRVGNVTH